jgi:phosphinothricin acetyltransferase
MITTRPATEDDLPQILSIYNEIIATTTAVYEYVPHTLEMRQAWYRGLRELNLPVFVALESDRVIGFCSLSPFRKWGAYKYSVESSVYVTAASRGRGVGKLLLAPLIDAAVDRELHTIVAGIDTGNEASIRLHVKFGFEEVAHFRQVGFKFGRWLDLKFWQRILPTPTNPQDG